MVQLISARSVRRTRSRVTRRSMLAVAAGGVAGAALIGCGAAPEASAPKPSTRPVTLEWFAKLKGVPQEQIDAYSKAFTTQRPNVTVNVTAVDNTAKGLEKLTTYQVSGNQLDVVTTLLGIPEARKLKAGYALNDLIKRDKFDTSQFATNTFKAAEVKGKVLALPHAYAGDDVGVVVNKTVFSRAGVPLPAADWKSSWTWDQFRDAMKKITNPNANPSVAGASRFGTYKDVPPLWQAQWATEDGKVTSDSAAMIEALTQYYDMMVKDRSTTFTWSATGSDWARGTPDSLAQGRAGLYTICCAVPTTTPLLKDVDWAFAPFPRAKTVTSDTQPAYVFVWSQTKFPEEAWQFGRYAVEDGRLANLELRMPSLTKTIPVYIQANYGSMPQVRPEVLQRSAEFAPPPDPLLQSPAAGDADKLITDALKEVTSGAKVVRTVLTDLKPQLQALMDQYKDS